MASDDIAADHEADDGAVVLVSPSGAAMVAGADERVDRLIDDVSRPGTVLPLSRLSSSSLSDIAAALGTAIGLLQTRGVFFEMSADSLEALRAGGHLMPAGGGWVRGVIRGGTGQITDLARLRPAALGPGHALSVQLAATTLALMVATANVERAIAELAVDMTTVRSISEGEQVGDVVGLHRVLAAARSQTDELGYVPDSTWASIAPHGVTAQQQADRARAIALRLIGTWPVQGSIGDQEQFARNTLKQGTLRGWLSVVAHAEANLLLWQSLKLDRVRGAEPELLDNEARLGDRIARENRDANQHLVDRIAQTIHGMGAIETIDQPHWIKIRRLHRSLTALDHELAAFAEPRGLAVEPYAHPTGAIENAYRKGEAWTDAGILRSRDALRVGRRAFGEQLQRAGEAIAGERPAISAPEEADSLALEPAEPNADPVEPPPASDE